jgi:hypothetical protein
MNKINDEVNKKRSKDMWSLLPMEIIQGAVKSFTYGASKYSKDNWKTLNSEDYYNAFIRHLVSDLSGEILDESGQEHLDNCLASLIMYIYLRRKERKTNV